MIGSIRGLFIHIIITNYHIGNLLCHYESITAMMTVGNRNVFGSIVILKDHYYICGPQQDKTSLGRI